MSSPAELPRPGVEVIQVFRSVSPTIVTPTLKGCVVGVAKQIVDVLVPSASGSNTLNTDALVSLPAVLLLDPETYNVDGLHLDFSVNNAPDTIVTFVGTGLTAAQLVSQINRQLVSDGNHDAIAEVVDEETPRARIRTRGTGDFQSLEVKSSSSPTIFGLLGLNAGKHVTGQSTYQQYRTAISEKNFPDPRANIAELAVELDTIRAFLYLGSGASVQEVKRTETYLRGGGSPAIATLKSSLLSGLVYATYGTVTGNVDIRAGGGAGLFDGEANDISGLTFTVQLNSTTVRTVTFRANIADETELIEDINNTAGLSGFDQPFASIDDNGYLVLTNPQPGNTPYITIANGTLTVTDLGITTGTTRGVNGDLSNGTLTIRITKGGVNTTINGVFSYPTTANEVVSQVQAFTGFAAKALASLSGGKLAISTLADNTGPTAIVTLTGGTKAATLGFTGGNLSASGTYSVQAVDDGNGDAVTPVVLLSNENLTAAATAAVVEGSGDLSVSQTLTDLEDTTLIISDGRQPQTIVFPAVADGDAVVDAINAVMDDGDGIVADLVNTNYLRLTSQAEGYDGKIKILGGTALTLLGLTVGTTVGSPHPVQAGDELFIDGVSYGLINKVAPGGVTNYVRLSRQLPLTFTGSRFYIIARNLKDPPAAGRPLPNLRVSATGTVTIKHDLLRDTTGNPPASNKASIYLAYHAVRLDLTARAKNAALLSFDDTTQLGNICAPINTQNPMPLGVFFALQNAPGVSINAIGVDEISADEPFGTVAGFTRAAEFLEQFDVYGIAPLTHNPVVHQVFGTHVTTLSEPTNKLERIVLVNQKQPVRRVDTLVASGAQGNLTNNPSLLEFDTGIQNLAALVLAAGLDPTTTIPVEDQLFLDLASDDNAYSIESIDGPIITLRNTFTTGENDDEFFTTDTLTDPLIDETFAIRIRGAALTLTNGDPDKLNMAVTYQQIGQSYGNRRVWMTMPDKTAAIIDGVEQVIEGFYMNAGLVGAISQQPPQLSFTNFPLTGYTRVIGSNGYFTEKQLNIIAAGGVWILVQDSPGAAITTRMALTTNMTSVEARTDSITKVVDFTAKFVRRGLKNFIGRYNINQGFLDTLGQVTQGLFTFLTDAGVLIGASLNNIVQDEAEPDAVLLDSTLDVPFPCNYVRHTLVI